MYCKVASWNIQMFQKTGLFFRDIGKQLFCDLLAAGHSEGSLAGGAGSFKLAGTQNTAGGIKRTEGTLIEIRAV